MTACQFAHDDGAYILGALSPADRAAYEKHLAGCAECRDAVADIAVLPSLLGRLDAAGLERIAPEPADRPAAADRLPALLEAAARVRGRERLARRRRYAGVGLAAAALALVVGVGAGWLGADRFGQAGVGTTPGTTEVAIRMVTMQPLRDGVPVTAEIGLGDVHWGTEVKMRCSYGPTDHSRAYTFRLVAYGADGTKEQVGSWVAGPGDSVTTTGVTRFGVDELVRLEVTRYDGTALLAYDVP
jgi:hypothetical protein